VSCIAKTATTMPTFLCMNNIAGSILAVGTGMVPFGTQLAQTDLVDPATIALTGTPCAFWMAVS
jgi:hypothetical protein